MFERIAVWVLSLPLMLGGSAIAHWLAYRLVFPSGAARGQVLAESGHGYLTHAPQAIAVASAIGACALAVHVASRRRARRPGARVALLPFAALPPAAFVLQEHLERLLHDGALPVSTAVEPTFAIGLLLQLPFAAVAYLVARLLLHVAERVAGLRREPPPRGRLTAILPPAATSLLRVPRASVLAFEHAGRGPPRTPLASV